MNTDNEKRTYIYNHTSQETAYVVQDYPWGFRLRTTIRYWIESKKAKNGGQRFASQTINPKTGKWCAPKYSTYSEIIIMYLDENKHVKAIAMGMNSDDETINDFKQIHFQNMDEFQKEQLRRVIAWNEVMKHVTFEIKPSKIGPVSLLSQEPTEIAKRETLVKEQEESKIREGKIVDRINQAIVYEYKKNRENIA